jgi:hypothetical protein
MVSGRGTEGGKLLHEAIAKKAALGLNQIYATWRKNKKMNAFVVAWPLDTLSFKNTWPTNNEVVLDLPDNQKTWGPIIQRVIETTGPFAVLLAQQKEDEILLVLESAHGSSSWHIPIHKHAHEHVLGQPSTKTDVDAVGLLWKAGKKN